MLPNTCPLTSKYDVLAIEPRARDLRIQENRLPSANVNVKLRMVTDEGQEHTPNELKHTVVIKNWEPGAEMGGETMIKRASKG